MKRDLSETQLGEVSHLSLSLIDRYRQRGERDAPFPSTEQETRTVLEEIHAAVVEPAKQAQAGQCETVNADLLSEANTLTVTVEDVCSEVETAAFNCGVRVQSRLAVARAELVDAAAKCRDTKARLMGFLVEHQDVAKRPPLPPRTGWESALHAGRHALLAFFAALAEMAAFLLLGHDAPRAAVAFGVIGGTVIAIWLGVLQYGLTSGRSEAAMGRRGNRLAVGGAIAGIVVIAYAQACIRDSLVRVNNDTGIRLRDILVLPADLTPEGGMVAALTVTIMIAAWWLALGRRDFPFEDLYRALHDAQGDADATYLATAERIRTEILCLIEVGNVDIAALLQGHDAAHRASNAAFADAQQQVRQLHSKVSDACRLANQVLRAYCEGNMSARPRGTPIPQVLLAGGHFSPGPGLERDLFAGFIENLAHARTLAAAAKGAHTDAIEALAVFGAEAQRHLSDLIHDPLNAGPEPRFEITIATRSAPTFRTAAGGARRPPGGVVRRFLGIDAEDDQ